MAETDDTNDGADRKGPPETLPKMEHPVGYFEGESMTRRTAFTVGVQAVGGAAALAVVLPAVGFAVGVVAYSAAGAALARQGARHRKRSGDQQPSETEASGSGAAIAVGALLDGVPESAVIGVSLLGGSGVGVATVAAVFLSNLPEGLSSAAGMKRAGRSARYVFGVWGGIAVVSGLAALIYYVALGGAPPAAIAVITAVAAGAIGDHDRRHDDPGGLLHHPDLDRADRQPRLPGRLRHRAGLNGQHV